MRYLMYFVLAMGTLTVSAKADVILPGTSVAGISQATLADQWYRWILEAPASTNPLYDPSGAWAHVDNNGPVFLLAGSSGGGFISRSFSVPAGQPLFFPTVNIADVEVPVSMDPTSCIGSVSPSPYDCAMAYLNTFPLTGGLVAKLNGVDLVADFTPFYHVSSALESFCPASSDNLFGVPAGECGAFVQKGTYLALDGLAPGTYTLEFGSTEGGYGAIDTITVTPEPAAMAMLGVGLLGIGVVRRASREGRQASR